MSGGVDLALLRQLVGDVVATLPDHYTHRGLGEACECLGLPEPPGEDGHSKRERVDDSFVALPDADLLRVAERILASDKPPQPAAAARNAIQDVLWAGQDAIEIPKRAGVSSPGTSTSATGAGRSTAAGPGRRASAAGSAGR